MTGESLGAYLQGKESSEGAVGRGLMGEKLRQGLWGGGWQRPRVHGVGNGRPD